MKRIKTFGGKIVLLTGFVFVPFGAVAQSTQQTPPTNAGSADDVTVLAKELKNPVGDLYSITFQKPTNLSARKDILNVQARLNPSTMCDGVVEI
nr:hypothetical protein [uncultured Rhodopila sp.]